MLCIRCIHIQCICIRCIRILCIHILCIHILCILLHYIALHTYTYVYTTWGGLSGSTKVTLKFEHSDALFFHKAFPECLMTLIILTPHNLKYPFFPSFQKLNSWWPSYFSCQPGNHVCPEFWGGAVLHLLSAVLHQKTTKKFTV